MSVNRNEFLKPISREYQHGLLVCWKMSEGMDRQGAAGHCN